MSKKTLKNVKAKTKSERNKPFYISLSFIVILAVVVPVWLIAFKVKASIVCLQTTQECFTVGVADKENEKIAGLSNRVNLPEDKGMLFVFEDTEKQCFWMRNMRFNLDIIWLDDQKTITKTKENISPDTYPNSFCGNAKYVLEFNHGFTAKYGLKPGTTLQF